MTGYDVLIQSRQLTSQPYGLITSEFLQLFCPKMYSLCINLSLTRRRNKNDFNLLALSYMPENDI